jgi:hypothetical protein
MKLITIDQIMAFRPCGWSNPHDGVNYTRERVEELFAGRETISPIDILDAPIPTYDRIWAWVRVTDRAIIVEFACCCFERVAAPAWNARFPGDDRPQKCVDMTRAFMRGEISVDELKKAWAAARAAAEVAWGESAMDSVSQVESDWASAAESAALVAVWSASAAAAELAAVAAAEAAEEAVQSEAVAEAAGAAEGAEGVEAIEAARAAAELAAWAAAWKKIIVIARELSKERVNEISHS